MRAFGSYLTVIAAMLASAQAARASDANPQIVVAVAPVASFVGTITQQVAPAQSLLQPGQDPHHFSLAPSQGRMLDTADVLIIPDLSMSPILQQTVKSHPHLHIIELSKLPGADALSYARENPWLGAVKKAGNDVDVDEDEAPPHAAQGPAQGNDPHYKKLPDFDTPEAVQAPDPAPTTDPHLWLDPERMAALAPALAAKLGDLFPAHRQTLAANARTEAAHLRRDVLPEMRALLTDNHAHNTVTNAPVLPFITYHAAYQYFLGRFGLEHRGEITTRPEDYLGARSLDALLATAKTTRVRCIIGEGNTPLAERIAELTHAKIVVLSPEQNIGQNEVPPLSWATSDYDRLLYKTAKSFGDCL